MTVANGAATAAPPHFVLVPLYAQGHMIPTVDFARLLADRGVLVSVITTPVNAARIRSTIDRIRRAGLTINFVELPFPCLEFGLPEGCENLDLIHSKDLFIPFFNALEGLQKPLEDCLRSLPPANCMVVDMCNFWATPVARDLGIPRLVFHGPSCFYNLCSHQLRVNGVYERVADDYEKLMIPDMPHPVEICKAHAPGWFNTPVMAELRTKILDAEETADGLVENTFEDIEKTYIDHYEKVLGKRVYTVGPLCVFNKDFDTKIARGNKAAIDEKRILSWLNSREDSSVIYISFGSLARLSAAQIFEIGAGLEASDEPFIWVVKEVDKLPEVEKWLVEEFEERTSDRGLVIKGWAPQVVILSHPSVGGFLTHCGWNSTQEAISAGVPMITWPFFADQFCNERLIVDELKIGVSLGIKKATYHLTDEDGVQVTREDMEKAVRRLMDRGDEGEERRRRAKELGIKAHKALEEGGSSYRNLTELIEAYSGVAGLKSEVGKK